MSAATILHEQLPLPQASGLIPRALLQDQVAVVTGGSRGIGRATALRLAEAGAKVVVNYVEHRENAERTVYEARALGTEAFAVRGDVSHGEQAARICEAALQRFGRIDVLVANAGVWRGAPIEEMTEGLWDDVIGANLKGTWSVCRAAAAEMKARRRGSIVIVSSTAGQRGEAGYSNYAASKGGQISFAKSLASELAPHVRVNCVAPGWVDTELNDSVFCDGKYKQQVAQAIPLGRIATADDVALAIVFLTSEWSRHITGEVLNVNGGAVMCG
jgi:3-oxoacyl-[acyl-carrier protein] reductase